MWRPVGWCILRDQVPLDHPTPLLMTSNAEGLSLIRTIAGTARPLALLTALSYAAAVAVLTWLTVDGYFGDSMYGGVLMPLLAFPFFLVGLTVDQLLLYPSLRRPRTSPSAVAGTTCGWPGQDWSKPSSSRSCWQGAVGVSQAVSCAGCLLAASS